MDKESSFSKASKIALNRLDNYLEQSKTGWVDVLKQNQPKKIATDLNLESYLKTGGLLEQDFDYFLKIYLQNTQRLHHPHFLGHQIAAPNLGASMADYIHGTINNPMAIYEMGPGCRNYGKINGELDAR